MQDLLLKYKTIFSYNLRNLIADGRKLFVPKEPLTVSQHAEKFRYVTREESARYGQWENSVVPFAIEIMNDFNDPKIDHITMDFSAQVVKTEIIKNMIAYAIDYEPSPMLIVYPTDGDARDFSSEKLEPMLNGNRHLSDKMAPAKANSKDNKTLFKKFWGGFLAIAGGRVPQELARRSVKYVFADDRDRIGNAGDEGDAVSLAYERTESYDLLGRKLIEASTPTIDGESAITESYEKSDKRKYYAPCPYCFEFQTLEWENLKWEKDKNALHYKNCDKLLPSSNCNSHAHNSYLQI